MREWEIENKFEKMGEVSFERGRGQVREIVREREKEREMREARVRERERLRAS